MLFAIGNDPGGENGSIVIDVDMSGNITFQYALQEQGACTLIRNIGGNVVIPGNDPTESWDFGNIYVDGTKKRTLTNTIHSLGVCLHNGYLFVSAGVHLGDEATFRGYVFRSDDLGNTWDSPVQVSNYRVYDIISFNDLLYAIADNFQDLFVAVSDDDGQTWLAVGGVVPKTLTRMIVWNNLLVILTSSGSIQTIDASENIVTYDPPPYQTGISTEFNIFAVYDIYLYVLCNDRLYRTSDLTEWEWHCDLERQCTGLAIWDGFGLIVSEIGADARLLRVPIA